MERDLDDFDALPDEVDPDDARRPVVRDFPGLLRHVDGYADGTALWRRLVGSALYGASRRASEVAEVSASLAKALGGGPVAWALEGASEHAQVCAGRSASAATTLAGRWAVGSSSSPGDMSAHMRLRPLLGV